MLGFVATPSLGKNSWQSDYNRGFLKLCEKNNIELKVYYHISQERWRNPILNTYNTTGVDTLFFANAADLSFSTLIKKFKGKVYGHLHYHPGHPNDISRIQNLSYAEDMDYTSSQYHRLFYNSEVQKNRFNQPGIVTGFPLDIKRLVSLKDYRKEKKTVLLLQRPSRDKNYILTGYIARQLIIKGYKVVQLAKGKAEPKVQNYYDICGILTIPTISREDYLAQMAQYSTGLITSVIDTFPLTAVEALLAGLNVVAPNLEDYSEILPEKLLYSPFDTKEIIKKIEEEVSLTRREVKFFSQYEEDKVFKQMIQLMMEGK